MDVPTSGIEVVKDEVSHFPVGACADAERVGRWTGGALVRTAGDVGVRRRTFAGGLARRLLMTFFVCFCCVFMARLTPVVHNLLNFLNIICVSVA